VPKKFSVLIGESNYYITPLKSWNVLMKYLRRSWASRSLMLKENGPSKNMIKLQRRCGRTTRLLSDYEEGSCKKKGSKEMTHRQDSYKKNCGI
jgi:hypothetical protein